MNRSKKILVGVVVFFIVVLFTFFFAFVMYNAKSFPQFNELVDSIVKKEEIPTEQPEFVVKEADFQLDVQPAFAPIVGKGVSLLERDAQEVSQVAGDASGEFAHKLDDFTIQSFHPEWNFTWNEMIVSTPGVFSDAVVFMDAKSTVVVIERKTGSLLSSIPCGVFPSEKAFVDGSSYYFMARCGSWYELRFAEEPQSGLSFLEPVPLDCDEPVYAEQLLEEYVIPCEEDENAIMEKMNSLFSLSEKQEIKGFMLYSEQDGVLSFDRDFVSPVFVFSPMEQGTYVLGLCNPEGEWTRENAFVVLFSSEGQTVAVSLDYVADRPQITTHLSDSQLYYCCAGFMDAAQTAPSCFQIKKAP